MKNILKAFIYSSIIQSIYIALVGGTIFTALITSIIVLQKVIDAVWEVAEQYKHKNNN